MMTIMMMMTMMIMMRMKMMIKMMMISIIPWLTSSGFSLVIRAAIT